MIEELIRHLRRYAELANSVDVERFEATLNQIAELHDPRAIALLLPFFNDNCYYPEAMFSIIHTIELFPDEIYVQEIIKGLRESWQRAPYWLNVIHFRIFNKSSTFGAYRSHLTKADTATKSVAKEIFTNMQSKYLRFTQPCGEILAILRGV